MKSIPFSEENLNSYATGAYTACAEAQTLGQLFYDINNSYAQGDPDIQEEMRKSWENYSWIPDNRKPSDYQIPDKEIELIKNVMMIFYKNRASKADRLWVPYYTY